jgi:hypothetical protein
VRVLFIAASFDLEQYLQNYSKNVMRYLSGERRLVGLETFLEGARGESWIVMIFIACVFKKVYETTALR